MTVKPPAYFFIVDCIFFFNLVLDISQAAAAVTNNTIGKRKHVDQSLLSQTQQRNFLLVYLCATVVLADI